MTIILREGDSREQIRLVPWTELPKVRCVLTDPPYGVGFQSGFAATEKGKQYARAIEGDADLPQAISLFVEVMALIWPLLDDEAELYFFTQWTVLEAFRQAINEEGKPYGVQVYNALVWEKGWPGLGDLAGNWPNSFEMILYAKKGRRPIPSRDCSVIAIDRLPSSQMVHPTEKPVKLIRRLLEMSTSKGDLVVDPFAGSFSTAEGCRDMERRCVAIEKDHDHFIRGQRRLSALDLFS